MYLIRLKRDGKFSILTPEKEEIIIGDSFTAIFTGECGGFPIQGFNETAWAYFFELEVTGGTAFGLPDQVRYVVASKIVGPYLCDVLEKGKLHEFKSNVYHNRKLTWYQPIVDGIECGLFGARR